MGVPRTVVPRRVVTAIVVVITIAAVLLSSMLVVALGLVVLGVLAVMPTVRRRAPWPTDALAWLPIGACAALGVAVFAVVVTGRVGWALWSPGWARWSVLGLVVLVAAPGLLRRGRVALWSSASLVAWIPAAGLIVAGVIRFSHPMSYWSRPAWSLTDWVNNAEMTIDLVKNHLLAYTSASQSAGGPVSVYPRGLHSAVAWLVNGVVEPGSVPAAWTAVITALFVLSTVLVVLVTAGAGLAAMTVARRLCAPTWAVVVSPLVTGVLLLHPDVYNPLAVSGFLTTTASALLLFALVLLAAWGPDDRGYAFRVVGAAGLTFLAFHLWQLLAVPAAVLTAVLLWRWWRSGHSRLPAVAAVVVVAALGCLPLALVTLSPTGREQASIPAIMEAMPVAVSLSVIAIPVVVLLVSRARRQSVTIPFVATEVTLVVLALVLTMLLGGWSDNGLPYYAGKIMWHATVLALPACVAALIWLAVRAWGWAGRLGGLAIRVLVVVAPAVLLLALVGGRVSFGISGTVGWLAGPIGPTPQVAMSVLDQPQVAGGRAVMPYLLNPQGWQLWLRYDDWQAAQMLRTLGTEVPDQYTLLTHRVEFACEWLKAHPDAVRLTGPRRGDQNLIERGCPADVVRPDAWTVITTPGEWWQDTAWAATDGAPDPGLPIPKFLLDTMG